MSYKLNGSNIDYSKTKTIQIAEFPIRATYVWGPMESMFNNELKNIYANHTKLSLVKRNGDLKVEGEITQYSQRNKSVSSEGYSAQTELSITVNVRFTNNVNHAEDFERSFTSTSSYSTTQSLAAVQEGLVQEMIKDITEQINNTAAEPVIPGAGYAEFGGVSVQNAQSETLLPKTNQKVEPVYPVVTKKKDIAKGTIASIPYLSKSFSLRSSELKASALSGDPE